MFEPYIKINIIMLPCSKLMLAKINWIFFTKPERYDEMMPKLMEALRVELSHREERKQQQPEAGEGEDTEQDVYGALNQHAPDIDIQGRSVRTGWGFELLQISIYNLGLSVRGGALNFSRY